MSLLLKLVEKTPGHEACGLSRSTNLGRGEIRYKGASVTRARFVAKAIHGKCKLVQRNRHRISSALQPSLLLTVSHGRQIQRSKRLPKDRGKITCRFSVKALEDDVVGHRLDQVLIRPGDEDAVGVTPLRAIHVRPYRNRKLTARKSLKSPRSELTVFGEFNWFGVKRRTTSGYLVSATVIRRTRTKPTVTSQILDEKDHKNSTCVRIVVKSGRQDFTDPLVLSHLCCAKHLVGIKSFKTGPTNDSLEVIMTGRPRGRRWCVIDKACHRLHNRLSQRKASVATCRTHLNTLFDHLRHRPSHEGDGVARLQTCEGHATY